jgi:hypothetical protein
MCCGVRVGCVAFSPRGWCLWRWGRVRGQTVRAVWAVLAMFHTIPARAAAGARRGTVQGSVGSGIGAQYRDLHVLGSTPIAGIDTAGIGPAGIKQFRRVK